MRRNDLGTLAYDEHARNGRVRHNEAPRQSTNAESYYYLKQMHSRTPMVVKLVSGEEICGVFEWYDENCIKVVQCDGIGIVVLKHEIKYIYKQNKNQS
jgi:sRNA-binding regulator protein Hfq